MKKENKKEQHTAFNKTWSLYQGHLLSFIKTNIDEVPVAEDILQEVGIKFYQNLQRGTMIKNPKTWLFQVTRNTISDYYRKTTVKRSEGLEELSLFTESTEACVCDVSGFVIQNYLPEKYGTPLYLSDVENKSQQEIASLLDLSITATKSRIRRARKKLKELIFDCVDVSQNSAGQVVDYQLKDSCELPIALKKEIEKLNLVL